MSIFGARKLITDLIIRYLPCSITGKIISKPNNFTGTSIFKLCSRIPSAQTNNSDFGSLLLSCLPSEIQKQPSPRLELRDNNRLLTRNPVSATWRQASLSDCQRRTVWRKFGWVKTEEVVLASGTLVRFIPLLWFPFSSLQQSLAHLRSA
jgi:hypothetical protein